LPRGPGCPGGRYKRFIVVHDKKAKEVITYTEDGAFSKKNPNRKFVTIVFIQTSEPEQGQAGLGFSLWMKIVGANSEQQETAKQIVQSIRF